MSEESYPCLGTVTINGYRMVCFQDRGHRNKLGTWHQGYGRSDLALKEDPTSYTEITVSWE